MANKDNPGLLEQAAPSRCSCGPRFRWLAWGQASCCGFPADGQKKFELASRISLVSTLFTVVLAINYVEKVFGGLHHLQSLQMQLASSMDAVARKPVETPLVAGPNSLPEQSPMKGIPSKAFIPLSPGPEKAKLHMEVVSSLLGLSSADLTHQAALVAQTSTPAIKQEMVGQWTASRSSDAALVRASKRLSASETYSRTLTLPRTLFEGFFGPQPASGSTTALLEPSSGALLALTAESSEDGATFSLRAGPLLNALRASAGDVLVLTAAPAEEGASARALAALQSGAAAKEAGSAAGSPTCIDTLTTPALVNGGALGRDHHIAVTDDDAGEPPATASNADACNGDLLSDGGDDRGTPGEGGDGYGGSLDDQDNVMMGGEADGDDPEWKSGRAIAAGVKTRGRPRKRKSFSTAGGPTAGTNSRGGVTLGGGAMSCTHCGTQETPRWWKDTFPLGTLCNACGIWLKRHGYPRPVQFFAGPAGMAPVPTGRVAAAAPPPDASAAEGPGPGEFYLINGRPKRRRAAAAASAGAVGAYGRVSSGDASGPLPDAPINFDAAGGRVFVVRRKLVVDQASGGVTAAMVHFGWAPAARAAHEMYDRVVQYTHPRCTVAVEDFELLADTKATATLVLAAGSPEPEDWDALVRHFVASL